MSEPFPMLRRLSIFSRDGNVPEIPCEFLGGRAGDLRVVDLYGISFPTLPALLRSATDLVELKLHKIPPAGYISPEAMVMGLDALPRLEYLSIDLRSPTTRRDPIYTRDRRAVLPALTSFFFYGISEYLEDFTSRIDAPRLNSIKIYYLNQLVDFKVPQVSNFIDRSENLIRSLPRRCRISLQPGCVSFDIGATSDKAEHREVSPRIDVCFQCQGID
jgi:hypothetical protein